MISVRHPNISLLPPTYAPADVVLTGHSGARLSLHQSGERSIIRKTSGTPFSNARLQQQAEKQDRFLAAGFPTPSIRARGLSEGHFFFEMDYIPAISIAAQCATGIPTSTKSLVDFLERWITYMREGTNSFIEGGKIHSKIDAVVEACRRNPILNHAMPAIVLLGSSLSRSEWPAIPEGSCHGDMTLENILIDTSNRLWLIDFDAPDLSSYWFDLAKMYQDLQGHWCLRYMSSQSRSPSRLNAIMAIRRLRSAVDELVAPLVPGLLETLAPLVALCLMRALPYCQEIGTALFILDRAHAIITEPSC